MNGARLDWQADYELGVEDIDLQHQFFLKLIKRLSDELARAADPDYRAALISELTAYARFHFISEENLMRRAGYRALAEHRQHHRDLLDQLIARHHDLMRGGTAEGAEQIVEFLADWLLRHSRGDDRRFANFLHHGA